jgi:hypothetical protein
LYEQRFLEISNCFPQKWLIEGKIYCADKKQKTLRIMFIESIPLSNKKFNNIGKYFVACIDIAFFAVYEILLQKTVQNPKDYIIRIFLHYISYKLYFFPF